MQINTQLTKLWNVLDKKGTNQLTNRALENKQT